MIVLRDSVQIEASPESVFGWLFNLCENYLEWHPDHVGCRYLSGSEMKVGSVIQAEEYLHGSLHKLRMKLTRFEPGSRIDYAVFPGLSGSFLVEHSEGECRFIAELKMGTEWPLIGPAMDRMLGRILERQILSLERHMKEEGENLKRLLEGADGASVSMAG